MNLSNATFNGATDPGRVTIDDAQGIGTITNDDSVTVSIGDATQLEGDAGTTAFNFAVVLSGAVSEDVTVKMLVDTLATQPMLLDSGYEDDRKRAHERIGTAINFILGTPYVFAQKGL